MNKIVALVALVLASYTFAAPVGSVPPQMPQKLSIGLFEDTGQTWMSTSGTKWNIRYRYLAYKWANNYGFGPLDGQFVANFFTETDAQGYMPAVAYYNIFDIPPSNTASLAKSQNVATMTEYFNDLKLFFVQAAKFKKPVLLVWEPDYMGYMRGSSTPTTSAAVASTGIPELAALPNNVAGINYAVLALRKATGASNVLITAHISGWASGSDIFHADTSSDLQPHVDAVYGFMQHALTPNIYTGDSFDLLSGDPLDRDSDFYRLVNNDPNRWWTINDSDSINSKSMNRYLEWLRLWNLKSSKRWVLWQLPLGNSLSPNTCASGYKDNRTEYFFGANSQAHLQKAVDVGVVSLLFGEGASCQTTRLTDNNYIRDNAKSYLASSGITLSPVDAGQTCTCVCLPVDAGVDAGIVDAGKPDSGVDAGRPDSGTDAGFDAGKPDSGVDAGRPDSGTDAGFDAGKPDSGVDAGKPDSGSADSGMLLAGYDFESGTQGFVSDTVSATVNVSATPVFTGSRSLAVNFAASTGTIHAHAVPTPDIAPGTVITYHVWVPAGSTLSSIQVFAQENRTTSWRWNSFWSPVGNLLVNGWNTFTVTLPSNASKLQDLGIEFVFTSAYTGTFYVDAITWNGSTAGVDAGSGFVDAGSKIDAGSLIPSDAGVIVGKAIKIQTIGDSITASVNSAFRCAMYSALVAKGYAPSFVGTINDQYSNCPEGRMHDGHSGITAEDIAAGMTAWIQQSQPDIIVYNSGTNSYRWWTVETGTTLGARQEGFIKSLFTARPSVKVLVWTLNPQSQVLVPPNNQDSEVMRKAYNDQIKLAVSKLKSQGYAVELLDTDTVLTVADTMDGVHPNEQADREKLGPAFTNAILVFLP